MFMVEDFVDTPLLTNWAIVQGKKGGPPIINGSHSFHEGQRIVAAEVLAADVMLRWILTDHGGYRLAGYGTGANELSAWPRDKAEGH
jgi:hypothetical protein